MAYDCQRELDLLIQQCDDMEESINAAGILALNYIDDSEEVYNNSSVNIQITDERWIKLCQDFDTFFRINPNEKRKVEFEVLKQRTQIVTKDALSSVRVLINAIKNDIIVRDTSNNIATDADKLHELVIRIKDIKNNPKHSSMARKSSLFVKPGENPDVQMTSYSSTQTFVLWAEDMRLYLSSCSIKDSKQVADILTVLDSFKGLGEEVKLDKIEAMLLSLEKNYSQIEELETENMKRPILANFPTETMRFHKTSGETYDVEGMLGTSGTIMSEDIYIPIETNDYFERKLPNGVTEYYKVIDAGYHKGTHGIPDHYQTKVEKIKNPIEYEGSERKKLIFISHSTQDKEYTKAFVDLIFAIGLNEDDIVCSSYPGVGIPLGEKVYEWLVEKFQEYDLHVLYFLSHNYYQSAACLNEMGAAWAMKQKWDGILLPGFGFSDIAGCIDPTQIGIKLDGDIDELKHRIGELKDSIVAEFGLRSVSNTRWENIRNTFISTIQEITLEPKQTKTDYSIAPIDTGDDTITIYACVMLLYAAEDDGQIMILQTLSGTSYQAGKVALERSQKPRELALWDDAVARLIKKGYIKKIGRKDPIFQVTTIGYSIADRFKEDKEIDCSMTPAEILEGFETE